MVSRCTRRWLSLLLAVTLALSGVMAQARSHAGAHAGQEDGAVLAAVAEVGPSGAPLFKIVICTESGERTLIVDLAGNPVSDDGISDGPNGDSPITGSTAGGGCCDGLCLTCPSCACGGDAALPSYCVLMTGPAQASGRVWLGDLRLPRRFTGAQARGPPEVNQ